MLLDVVKGGAGYKPISIVGLNDFHGQLDPTTLRVRRRSTSRVGGAASLGDDVRRGVAEPARPGAAARRAATTSAPRRPNSGAARRTSRRSTSRTPGAWTRRRYGNHEFDYGVDRLLAHIRRAPTSRSSPPTSSTTATGQTPDWVDAVEGVQRQRGQGRRHRRRAQGDARARVGRRHGGPDVPRRGAARSRPSPSGCAGAGVKVQVVVIHQGTANGHERRSATPPAVAWDGPILDDRRPAPGHDGRRDDRRPHPPRLQPDGRAHPGHRGHQRRRELLGAPADGRAAATSPGPAARPASPRTSASTGRADVKAIVDDANAQTAVLRNQVIGTQSVDIKRAPDAAARVGDGQHGRRRDAREVPGRRRGATPTPAACARTSSARPPTRGRAAVRDHLGRDVRGPAVRQPDGDRDAHRRPAASRRSSTGSRRCATRRIAHRPLPAGLGPQGRRSPATAPTPVVDRHVEDARRDRRAADADRRRPTPCGSSPTTSCTPAATATPCSPAAPTSLQPGDDLLQVAIDYVTAHSPVGPVVEGRIIGPLTGDPSTIQPTEAGRAAGLGDSGQPRCRPVLTRPARVCPTIGP